MDADREAVLSLHRYWVSAEVMREKFHTVMNRHLETGTDKAGEEFPEAFALFSVWYGLLETVVEGWERLGLTHPGIDPLVADPKRDLLRRFRNKTFHYQTDYFHDQLGRFLAADEAPTWALILHKRLGVQIQKRLDEVGGLTAEDRRARAQAFMGWK